MSICIASYTLSHKRLEKKRGTRTVVIKRKRPAQKDCNIKKNRRGWRREEKKELVCAIVEIKCKFQLIMFGGGSRYMWQAMRLQWKNPDYRQSSFLCNILQFVLCNIVLLMTNKFFECFRNMVIFIAFRNIL